MQRRAVARVGALPFCRQRLHRPVSSLSFASLDPNRLSGAEPGHISNLVSGSWTHASTCVEIIDPLNGEPFLKVPETNASELLPFIKSLKSCANSGLHNPLKNVERYLLYGDISAKAASILKQSEVENFFSRLIQRVSPKSLPQARGEVTITQKFLENFSGDQVRFLCKSFAVPGNHLGQQSHGYRWPYGPVAIITPFNFPLEIPVLQLLGALYMGNKPVLKVDSKVSAVMEQMLRLLHECGMPKADADFLNCDGSTMHTFLLKAKPNSTLFTGSSRVAETLAKDLSGRVKLEDSGFDWKILGPDVQEEDYVAWVCDQDAYACSGQKCSAQSVLFMHANWGNSFTEKLSKLAKRRKLDDLTIGPLLTVKTERFLGHVSKLKEIPGAKLLFGGEKLKNHNIPDVYGAVQATAVYVPLVEMLRDEYFSLVTTEIFGPLQVVTEYKSEELHLVLEACQRMEAQLTAAVVSNDPAFLQEVLGKTTNGTTYAGIRARTTGAPQNHWFGPASDPRAAGIGTPEAIKLVWSCHREIVQDIGPIPEGWTLPPPS